MHDVRQLACSEANNGLFLEVNWPLWPKTDSEEFTKFINYKQVVPLPWHLNVMNLISMLAWIAYLIYTIKILFQKN